VKRRLLLGLIAAVASLAWHEKAREKAKEKSTVFTGTLRFVDLETGFWQLATPQGNYVLRFKNRPADLRSLEGKTITVQGRVRSDLMSVQMAGDLLEVDEIVGR
jgi:hypothetical protein